MKDSEAIKYCEEHECYECIIFIKNLDKRTEDEKKNQQVMCWENLLKI